MRAELPEVVPQLFIEVKDKELGLLGFLAIDSFGKGRCCGGIRMAEDVSPEEIAYLARTMTLKFAFMNSGLGGAKAGIICPEDASVEQKESILAAFGRNLGPLLEAVWVPGGDLGVGARQLDVVKRAAGIRVTERPAKYKGGFFTAYGVFAAIRCALNTLDLGVKDQRFALEGYGSVGRPLAKLLYQAGGKIVAVSTRHGAIYQPDGLNIEALEDMAAEHADRVVERYRDAQQIDKQTLFSLDADVCVPGARPWAINRDNAEQIRARLVVSAANISVTPRADRLLHEHGVVVIPDFAANWGGILGGSMLNHGFDEQSVLDILDRSFELKISRLIEVSRERSVSVREVAEHAACSNRERNTQTAGAEKWFQTALTALRQEDGIETLIQRTGGLVYRKLYEKNKVLATPFRSLAKANAYRRLVSDVSFYR